MDTLAGQVYGFAVTITAGLSLGLLFDLYRLWRRATRPQRMVTALSDILFWMIATPLTYVYLLMGNWGELRFYVFLGLLLGLFLYFMVFSVLVLNLLITVSYYVAAVVGGLIQGFWLLVTLPWEGAARWRSRRCWQPGRVRISKAARRGRSRPKWLGPKWQFLPKFAIFRK
ncbi:MAG: spore cortex biosynthesis protein YabQ [Firmicutes bacterium]|nr:spore cortex biosynthesis protein YabQ [Bacillota bacterium]